MRKIINSLAITDIIISTDSLNKTVFSTIEINTVEKEFLIELDDDYSKYDELIELTILNAFNGNNFNSINKLEKSIYERIKSAIKADEEHENRNQ